MPEAMPDPTVGVVDFPGRGELDALLETLVPPAWAESVRSGDTAAIEALRDAIDRGLVVRTLGEAGWIAPHYAVEHGGRGLTREEAGRALTILNMWDVPHMPLGSGVPLAAPTIDQWAQEATKRHLLPPLMSGAQRWCQLFSEPGAGSDMASLATTAVRDGDEWVVNGQKVWTTFGHLAERAMLLARTDPDQPKHKGITYFGLDMRSPGVEVRPLINMAGQREFNEVYLTDVRVPDIDRISPVGEGWGAALTTLGAERHALSGLAKKKRKASDEILGGKPYADIERLAVARGVGADPVARQRLMAVYIEGRVLTMNIQRDRARAAAGQALGAEGSLTKVAKAASNQHLQEVAMDLLGADAMAWMPGDHEAEEWITQFLRTRANSIEGGTSEIQRNIIGERMLGLPREPDPYKGEAWRATPR
ncbi:MAG: acyl-CoA dehydrogenase family protein [Acidimicrobiales bacterium]